MVEVGPRGTSQKLQFLRLARIESCYIFGIARPLVKPMKDDREQLRVLKEGVDASAFRHSDHWPGNAGSTALFGDGEHGNTRSIVGVGVPSAFLNFKMKGKNAILHLAGRLDVIVSDDWRQVGNIGRSGHCSDREYEKQRTNQRAQREEAG